MFFSASALSVFKLCCFFRSCWLTFNSWHVNQGALDTWSLEVSIFPDIPGPGEVSGTITANNEAIPEGMNNNTYWHLKVPCQPCELQNVGLIPQASTSYKPCILLSTSQVRYPSRHTAWSAAKHLVSTILSKRVEYVMYLWHSSTRPTYGYAPKSCIHQNWIKLACS